jgi:cytochrome c oxidase subunit 4
VRGRLGERVVPPRTYVITCLALLVLAGATTGIALLDLGPWNAPIALAIATVKATLIAVFFMELKLARSTQRLALALALMWLAILIGGSLDDLLTRGWVPVPGK